MTSVELPSEWADVDGSPWVNEGQVVRAQIKAAASMDNFNSYWNEPEIFFGASDDLAEFGGYIQILDIRREAFIVPCELDGRYDYEDVLYRGKFDLFTKCGGIDGAWFFVLMAVPKDDPTQFIINIEMQIVTEGDLEAVFRILDSLEIVATMP